MAVDRDTLWTMNTLLFLDDIRNPDWVYGPARPCPVEGKWVIARNYESFVEHINTQGMPAFLSFDHDLGEDTQTGMDCAHWLVNYCLDNGLGLPPFLIHSANPPGRDNLVGLLEGFNRFRADNS